MLYGEKLISPGCARTHSKTEIGVAGGTYRRKEPRKHFINTGSECKLNIKFFSLHSAKATFYFQETYRSNEFMEASFLPFKTGVSVWRLTSE